MNRYAFTPLENATEGIGSEYKGDGSGLEPRSSITVRGRSSLSGFTLTELIIVTVIIGILVSVAVPTYIDTMERTRGREAMATLQSIYGGERVYGAERRIFLGLTTSGDSDWQAIGMDNPNNNNQRSFNYVLTLGTGSTMYTATATRNTGRYSGSTVTINNGGTMGGTWPF